VVWVGFSTPGTSPQEKVRWKKSQLFIKFPFVCLSNLKRLLNAKNQLFYFKIRILPPIFVVPCTSLPRAAASLAVPASPQIVASVLRRTCLPNCRWIQNWKAFPACRENSFSAWVPQVRGTTARRWMWRNDVAVLVPLTKCCDIGWMYTTDSEQDEREIVVRKPHGKWHGNGSIGLGIVRIQAVGVWSCDCLTPPDGRHEIAALEFRVTKWRRVSFDVGRFLVSIFRILIRLRVGVSGSTPGRGERFFFSSKRPNRLGGPPGRLFNVYHDSFPRLNWGEGGLTLRLYTICVWF
jgi:hypothetical protein